MTKEQATKGQRVKLHKPKHPRNDLQYTGTIVAVGRKCAKVVRDGCLYATDTAYEHIDPLETFGQMM